MGFESVWAMRQRMKLLTFLTSLRSTKKFLSQQEEAPVVERLNKKKFNEISFTSSDKLEIKIMDWFSNLDKCWQIHATPFFVNMFKFI